MPKPEVTNYAPAEFKETPWALARKRFLRFYVREGDHMPGGEDDPRNLLSLQVKMCRTNDYATMLEAARDGAVYDLTVDNAFGLREVEDMLKGVKACAEMEGLNHSQYLFAVRVEFLGGEWSDYVSNLEIDTVIPAIYAITKTETLHNN